jgi:hypothetical protein
MNTSATLTSGGYAKQQIISSLNRFDKCPEGSRFKNLEADAAQPERRHRVNFFSIYAPVKRWSPLSSGQP